MTARCHVQVYQSLKPLISIFDNPDDLKTLTPGQFLAPRPLAALPDDGRPQQSVNEPWQKLKAIYQMFWQRWTKEYLHLLQRDPEYKDRIGGSSTKTPPSVDKPTISTNPVDPFKR